MLNMPLLPCNMRDCNYARDSPSPTFENVKELFERNKFCSGSISPNELLSFSAVHDELQPCTSSFMLPGIYKRITSSTATALPPSTVDNVFLSEKESQGRIIRAADFKKLYLCVSGGDTTRLPRRVVLLRKKAMKEKVPTTNTGTHIEPNFNALTRLAHNILKYSGQDHIVIDRKRNQIVRTENGTNQQTIYRVIAPETLGLKPPDKPKPLNSQPIKLKLGRPRKTNDRKETIQKSSDKPEQSKEVTKTSVPPTDCPELRTRFGRTVKFIKPHLTAGLAREENLNAVPIETLINDLRDSDYQCNQVEKLSLVDSIAPTPLEVKPTEPLMATNCRRFPPEAHCPTCNKIFLGRRMQRHFLKHPDHAKPTTQIVTSQSCSHDEMSLFRFLVTKMQRPHINEDQRADLFLTEINDFVEQLQLRSSRLIRNASGLHLVNGRTARVLGIPEGHYAFDMHAMVEAQPPAAETESHTLLHGIASTSSSVVQTRHLDYTQLSMSMDDTITDETAQKLNLSAGGKLLPPSEETLLRVVGDLVHDDLKKMDAGMLMPTKSLSKIVVPHYDHASDNAVEALHMKETPTRASAKDSSSQPILDLAVDYFKFANSK